MPESVGDINDFNEQYPDERVQETAKKSITISIEHDGKVYGETMDATRGFILSIDEPGDYNNLNICSSNTLLKDTTLALLRSLTPDEQHDVISEYFKRVSR